MSITTIGQITTTMARELAEAEGVCARPLLRRVFDRDTGTETMVALGCGSTRESVCPACAIKSRKVRMQQCAEGWHRTDEPERDTGGITTDQDDEADTGSITDDQDDNADTGGITQDERGRRVRSTKRRQDVPDLPKLAMSDRTVGVVFTAPNGTQYRPSMFLTLTLPSYGTVQDGIPTDPETYNYRRAALDAVLFPRLLDQFWKTLRRCAGYEVQYFAAIEPQHRLAPHMHAAIRGAIPRQLLRQVAKATYLQVWWPTFDRAVYTTRLPEWTGADYADPFTGELLPTWDQALDAIDADPDARAAHVMRFGAQLDMQGILRGQREADRAIRYLTKYITKDVGSTADETTDPEHRRHADRMHAELRYLPCSEQCANWLRYGVQPKDAGSHLTPGHCQKKAHRRDHLGIGGRRVLVSRKWSSKTLARHRADRATVVREALASAGIVAPDTERISASLLSNDGQPRYQWAEVDHAEHHYAQVVLLAVAEQRRWRTQYREAQQARAPDSYSATG